jgi:hypothetical protein
MKLSEFKNLLSQLEQIAFELPDGTLVPNHFHVTEVGKVVKHFIDCGGTERLETKVNFQLWEANDYDHQIYPDKLSNIIALSQSKLGLPDVDIEVEYQASTIGKYGIDFNGSHFLLTSTVTDCLAKNKCGIPQQKQRVKISEMNTSCAPNSGCC